MKIKWCNKHAYVYSGDRYLGRYYDFRLKNPNINYTDIVPDKSLEKWSIHDRWKLKFLNEIEVGIKKI